MVHAPYRVLIIDDAADVRQTLRWALEEVSNLTVVGEAEQGEIGLQLAEKVKPDVVILDIILPGLDGYAVARRLKQLPYPPRIVFLTVHSEEKYRKRALDAGGDAFVAKSEGWNPLLKEILAR